MSIDCFMSKVVKYMKNSIAKQLINQNYINNSHLCIETIREEINIIDKKIHLLKKNKLYHKIPSLENKKIGLYKKIEHEINDINEIKKAKYD